MRREFGEKYKNMTPDLIRRDIYKRNIEEYGDELGPSFDRMFSDQLALGATPQEAYEYIIAASQRPNRSLNKFLEIIKEQLP